jgi:2'-5' RNA ligase
MATVGDAGVVVLVPEAEPLVGAWRDRHDMTARRGMPAHVTLLFPWLPADRRDDATLERLGALLARFWPIDLELARTARFPDTIYLGPEPAHVFRAMTAAIVEAWPECPPYGGQFDDVVPHLTVATGIGEALMDRIDADLTPQLPVRARATEAQLWSFDGERWVGGRTFPFADR